MRSRYVLLGLPVGHSPAPAMYGAAFSALGVDADYTTTSVTDLELSGAMRRIAERGGGNITLPHKRRAAALLDVCTPSVDRSGACNCFWRDRDGSLVGDNTDIAGFLRSVRRLLKDAGSRLEGSRTLVLGAGGAARAVLVGLDEAGASVAEILNRTRLGADRMRDELQLQGLQARVLRSREEVTGRYDLVINATSLGLQASDALPLDLSCLETTVAFDCVYGRDGTAWTRHARGLGWTAGDGLDMLVEQARASVLDWLGAKPPAGPMREAALAALAR
ncbi:MAG: shikimate dehydrogenase [Gemmatimonadales bacterium]